MRFNKLYEKKANPEHTAVSSGVQELDTDQWMGTYKWSKDVAGHDGEKQHAPESPSGNDVYTDKPVVVGFSDADDKMTKAAMNGKVKQTVGSGSEEPKTVNKSSPLSKNESMAEGYYDLNDDGMQPIDFSSNPSFKELVARYTQLVYQGHTSETDPEEDQEHDEIEQYVAQHFGEKGSAHLQKAGEVGYWGRDDKPFGRDSRSSNLGRPNQPSGNFRTTKAGKMHGQDAKMMKAKVADRLGRHPEPNLPEDVSKGLPDHLKKHFDKDGNPIKGSWKDGKWTPNKGSEYQVKDVTPKGYGPTEDVEEAQNIYHLNRTGFARGPRDSERHDLDVSRPAPQEWALKINGKVWSKDGKAVTFTSKEQALKVRQSLLAKRPELEVGLVTRGGTTEEQGVSEAHPNSKIYDKCWTGYRKVPGKTRGEPGSCEKIKEDEVEEAEVRHDRYMRSHGKKASGGHGSWMFTNKEYGEPSDDETFTAPPGKFSDAVKHAKKWAKEKGHYSVYAMEDGLDEASLATMRDFFAGDEEARDPYEITKQRVHFSKDKNTSPTVDRRFPSKEAYLSWLQQQKSAKKESTVDEDVIYRLDKDNPMNDTEVLVIGGAGRYSLDGLRAKARREAEQLAKDLTIDHGGAFRRSAQNVRQLQNTLNTIVAAYDELNRLRKLGGVRSKGIKDEDATVVREGLELMEKWTQKYKNSINCSNPKGFSQKAHCAGKKK